MKQILLFFLLLIASFSFAQKNRYWVRFTDKQHNGYSLSNPEQFLSQASIDRRARQGILLNETDLPLTQSYIDSIAPFITRLNLRLKWTNSVVVEMNDAITLRTDTLTWRDTIAEADTFSITVYDTIIIHKQININGSTYSDTLTVSYAPVIVRDTFVHPGPIYIRDTLLLTDSVIGNNFDSIFRLPFIDTVEGIEFNPLRALFTKSKFEDEERPVNQSIIYPNKYGSAYHQINMLNADLLHQMGYNGQGIAVSVMDNGFYKADQIAAFDSVRPRILGTWDFVNNEQNVYNDGSHGENTFSCMAANLPDKYIGTAPGADYYLFTTEDDNAEWVMEEYNWAAAAEVADSLGAQLFSTSLGYSEFDQGIGNHTYNDLNGHTTVITRAANTAFGKGILIVNSAGNEGQHPWYHIIAPADGDSVLAVGSVDSARNLSGFSGRGPNVIGRIKPDVCAQGTNSAIITTPSGAPGYNNGTSFSCPIMAGCAASLWSAFPQKSAREIYDAIVISADRFWSPNNDYGYGIPNFYNAYLFLKTNYDGNVLRIADEAFVYPNPFTTALNLSYYNEEAGERKIELFDLQGRKVYSNYFHMRAKTFELVKIDAGVLQEGAYLIRLDGKRILTNRLLKLK